jgi:hypothetical protein
LNAWFKVQTVYIPVAQNLRGNQHGSDARVSGDVESDEDLEDVNFPSTDIDAEKVKLFLPSQLPPSLWSTGCMPELHDIEFKLRIAQASDSLAQLKQQLCVYSGVVHYKITQVSGPGQKANTRARSLLMRLWEKVIRCAERYKASRAALEALNPTGEWQEQFRPLLVGDIKGPNGRSADDVLAAMSKRSKGTGEGLRELSWIWRVRHKVPQLNTEELASETDLDGCESFQMPVILANAFVRIRYTSGVCKGKSQGFTLARRSDSHC